jgi:hypothetical protein
MRNPSKNGGEQRLPFFEGLPELSKSAPDLSKSEPRLGTERRSLPPFCACPYAPRVCEATRQRASVLCLYPANYAEFPQKLKRYPRFARA